MFKLILSVFAVSAFTAASSAHMPEALSAGTHNTCVGGSPIAIDENSPGKYTWEKCQNGSCPDDNTFCNTIAIGCKWYQGGKLVPYDVCWACADGSDDCYSKNGSRIK